MIGGLIMVVSGGFMDLVLKQYPIGSFVIIIGISLFLIGGYRILDIDLG